MRREFTDDERAILLGLEPAFYAAVMPVLERINQDCAGEDCHLTIEDGHRVFEQQMKLWKKGRVIDRSGTWRIVEPKKIVTKAMPGRSAHEYRMAVHAVLRLDLYPRKGWLRDTDPRWHTIIGARTKEAGLVWGGHFKGFFDAAHIEAPNWRELAKKRRWRGVP